MSEKLGQHFLINQGAIQKIIAALELERGETIIEIGPGRGALTLPLVEECRKIGCKVIGIEKDPSLAKKISENFQFSNTNLQILTEDALKFFLNWKLKIDNWKLVGNIPYYITGKLLRILSELKNKPRLIVVTVQKEVAERITAQPPRMNLLAAAVQFWAEPIIIQTLKPQDFSPMPKVESAIIKLEIRNEKIEIKTGSNYYKLIKILFKQPRKTILNNLADGLKISKAKIEAGLKKIGLSGQERPQNLGIETIVKLIDAGVL